MIENPLISGNYHDSSAKDAIECCMSCGGEIYRGEGYLDFDGDPIHTESDCIRQYVKDHSVKKVAGE